MITTWKKLEQSHPLCSALHLLMFSLQTNSFVVILVIFRHASVSRTYPCKLVSWLIGWSVTLSDSLLGGLMSVTRTLAPFLGKLFS